MSKRMLRLVTLPVLAMFLLTSCAKVDDRELEAAEQSNISNFLGSNPDLHFQQKESGLYYYEMTIGTGEAPAVHDTVCVVYTGKFLNGYTFDYNEGIDTFNFPLGEKAVIRGFDETVSYMKTGGRSLCLIPSKLAYGSTGLYPYVKGYTPLLYEAKLVRIIRAAR
jgi:FKBP-type peptidyl-prolyl cis-trans isomerase